MRVDGGAVGQLAAVVRRSASGAPTSIHVVSLPVRSRTSTAGSVAVDEIPSLKLIPSTYSRQYASTRVIMYASVSEGCRAARSVMSS